MQLIPQQLLVSGEGGTRLASALGPWGRLPVQQVEVGGAVGRGLLPCGRGPGARLSHLGGLPADHPGAALPELPPGAVPLHQGPGDAEEPVPDHGQRLCEWAGGAQGQADGGTDRATAARCLKTEMRLRVDDSPKLARRDGSRGKACLLCAWTLAPLGLWAVLTPFYRWGN